MNIDSVKQLLNEREVASACGISVLTLRKWRSLRRGPSYLKIGSLVRYRPAEVADWIERQAVVACERMEAAR